MASTSSIGGLASGLDTDTIIANLMAIEARPQALLKKTLSDTQAKATAYRAVNTRLNAVVSAADALSSKNLQKVRTASSSVSSVAASATASATPGSTVTFDVTRLATRHAVTLNQNFSSTTDPVTTPSFPIKVMSEDGQRELASIDVPAGSSLLGVVSAINSSASGLSATVVQLGAGRYRLQLEASRTGADRAFSLLDTQGGEVASTIRTQGADATVDLGSGMIAHSPSNTFDELISGTTITVSKVETGVVVSVGSDNAGLTSKMSALVEAVNGTLGLIKGYTVSTPGAALSTLQGDRALANLADQVLTAVSSGVGGLGSAAQIGLQLTRDGKLTFDTSKFASALAADPTKVTEMVTGRAETTTNGVSVPGLTGIAEKLGAIAKSASDTSTGTLTLMAKGRDTQADAISDKVDNWTKRLEKRKATLTAQFTALESALSTLKSQSSWLNSQVAQLYNPNKS